MPPFTQGLTIIQSGRESTKGTLVAATSKLAVESDLRLTLLDELARPKVIKGLLIANRGDELAVHRGVEWEIPPTILIFNQIQQILAMSFVGGIAPSGVGPYTWTYNRNPAADPTLDARTFEIRQTDGATPSDWEFGYGMCQSLEFTFAENEPVKWTARGFGRRLQTSTLTAGQALPTFNSVPTAMATAYIDTTWAGIGGTPVAGQVLGARFRLMTGLINWMTLDARTDLDFTIDAIDPDEVKVEIELVILATAGGQWATEKTAAEAATLRAVEIRGVGGADSIKLQALCKHTPGSVFPDEIRNGSRIITLRLEGSTDVTNFARAIVVNTAATLG